MLYDMRCDVCERELEVGCPMRLHERIIKPGIECSENNEGCAGTLRQVFKGPSMIINRSPFPSTGNEVQLPTEHGEDVRFQDKSHARDWLGERGLMSKWIENDM